MFDIEQFMLLIGQDDDRGYFRYGEDRFEVRTVFRGRVCEQECCLIKSRGLIGAFGRHSDVRQIKVLIS